MVQLIDLIVLIFIGLFIYQFWQLRKQSESALAYSQDYCERNNIQFVSVARKKTKIRIFQKKMFEWHSEFEFEFSGNGEDSNKGCLSLIDQRLVDITTEAYRVH